MKAQELVQHRGSNASGRKKMTEDLYPDTPSNHLSNMSRSGSENNIVRMGSNPLLHNSVSRIVVVDKRFWDVSFCILNDRKY